MISTTRVLSGLALGGLVFAGLVFAGLALVGCTPAPEPRPPVAIDVQPPVSVARPDAAPLQIAGDAPEPGEPTGAGDGVAVMPCRAEKGLRSEASTRSLFLDYRNARTKKVSLYWIDFEGRRVHYADLEPGQAYRQQTYVTHPWVAADGDGVCRALFVPREQGAFEVVIGQP